MSGGQGVSMAGRGNFQVRDLHLRSDEACWILTQHRQLHTNAVILTLSDHMLKRRLIVEVPYSSKRSDPSFDSVGLLPLALV